MIDDLRPYAEMKPSGLPWLGDVPAHWDILRSKYAFREVDRRSKTGEETHLSMSQRLGLVPANQVEKSLVSESYVGAKLVAENDLVLNRLKAHLGVFAYAKQPGLISPDYTVLRPMACANVRFFEYALKSPACRAELRTRAKGIVEGFWRLYTDDFYDIRLPIPPLDEQRLIVRFLDWHGAQTAKLIRAKKRIIALLGEEKQAIIHRAVTRGLDPNVKLKPSGIPWLGDVPEGWEVKRLKYVLREREERKGATEHELLSLTRKRGLIPQSEASERPPSAEDLSKYKVCVPNDIVMNRMQAWSGLFALADRIGVVSPDYAVFSVIDATLPEFLVRVLRSPRLVDQFAMLSQGIGDGFNRLYTPTLGAVEIALPPKKKQSSIVKAIEEHDAQVDHAVQVLDNEIALIQEFRTRLIADVVTGELDVRAIAASLPETVEPKATDDLAEDDDLDDAVDDAENEEVTA